jgi:TonB family protein
VVYRDGDADVVPPIPLKQTVPQWVVPPGTRSGAWQPEGVVELTIDESGDVINAILRKPFNASYDALLLKAAMAWKYEPARKAGVPVRFVRNVAIRLGGIN